MSILGRIARGVMARIAKHLPKSVNLTETRYANCVVEAMCWADALRRVGIPDECIKIELESAPGEGLSDEYGAVVTAWQANNPTPGWQKRLPIGDLADVFDKQLLALSEEWDPYTNPRWMHAWETSAAREQGIDLVMELVDLGFVLPKAIGF